MSRGYLAPLSHSSFPPPNTSFSLSHHPYPERRSCRVVDSDGGRLVRWRKTRETTASSCDGARRAIRHGGLVWRSLDGSCGRERGAVSGAASSGLLPQQPPPRRLLHAGRPNLAPRQPPEVVTRSRPWIFYFDPLALPLVADARLPPIR
jgi:hypothetical protein